MMLNILVCIPNYGVDQIVYLSRVIDEFKKYDTKKYKIDIVVHSNVPVPIDGIELIIIDHLDDWWDLPFIARKTIADRCSEYDLYIYNENDQVITQNNIESLFEISSVLPKNYLLGFVQYEQGDTMKYFPAFHKPYKWRSQAIQFGTYIFAEYSNYHQASFVLTKEQLHKAMKRLDFYKINKVSAYRQAERIGTDIYHCAGYTKLICLTAFDRLLIDHLPNKYHDFGVDENVVRLSISELTKRVVLPQETKGKLYLFKNWIYRFTNRLLYNNKIIGKCRREIERAINSIIKLYK